MAPKTDPIARQLQTHIEAVKALMQDVDRLLAMLRAEYEHLTSPVELSPDTKAPNPA